MAYRASYKDIEDLYQPESVGVMKSYKPSLSDISDLLEQTNFNPATNELVQKSQEGMPEAPKKSPYPKVGFFELPDISKMPEGERKEALGFPSSLKDMQEGMRKGSSLALPAVAGAFAPGASLFSRYVSNPIMNSLARIGLGTAGQLRFEQPDIKNWDDFRDVLKRGLENNAVLEMYGLPFRAPGYIAEMSNPIKYATNEANQLKLGYQKAREAENNFYNPVMKQYGQEEVPLDNYLNVYNKYKNKFGSKVKDLHNDLIANPTVENLHKTQSQMFTELNDIQKSISPDQALRNEKYALQKVRKAAINTLETHLEKLDPKAAKMYQAGQTIHRDVVKPHLSSKYLANIVEGDISKVNPKELENNINKLISMKNSPIPKNHPLRMTYQNMQRANHVAEMAKVGFPTALGALGGGATGGAFGYPGVGSLGGGGLGLLSGLTQFPEKLFGVAQNPIYEMIMNKLALPLGYGASRSYLYGKE